MLNQKIADEIHQQADHAAKNGAPATGAVCRAMVSLARGSSACGQKIAHWPRSIIEDAVPLRLAGGLHNLYRNGAEPSLGAIYSGALTDQVAIDALINDIVARHDSDLITWFDSPPQTNEAGRSWAFIAAMHWLASHIQPRYECLEIGSSAGMNLLVDRFRYDLGGVVSGPKDAPVTISPEWDGPPPPNTPFSIQSVRGCDLSTIDVRDSVAANRLRAYIWPEMQVRFTRMDAGIKMIEANPVDLVQADAADWIEAQLDSPQDQGVTRVMMHSIVWQYIPEDRQKRIIAALDAAAAKATADKPLAWISLETNRATFRHELTVRYWPGNGEPITLGEGHAHGIWAKWLV